MPDNERVNSPLDGSHGMSNPDIAKAYHSVHQGTSGSASVAEAAIKKAMDTNLLADTLAKRIKLTGGDQKSKEDFNKVQEELKILKEVLVQVAKDVGGKISPAEEMRLLRTAEVVTRTNERFAPKAPERPTDFHDRYPSISRPGYDMDSVRSDVRVARSHRAMGNNVEELPFYQDLKDNKGEIENQIKELHASFTEQRNKGTPEGRQAAREIATQIASTTNLRAELVNILEHSAGQQSSSFNKVMSFVGSLASTLGAASLVSRFAISEPYRFETQPGLQIMGQQGQMGAVLGSAFSELESYKYELDQTAFGTGAGMFATGAAGMFIPGASGLARAGAGALALGGIGIGAMGLTGTTHKFLSDVGLSKDEDEIMGQALAKQFSNPERLVGEFQNSRMGLYAMGGRAGVDGDNFGMLSGPRADGSTGNTYLDKILGNDGDLLRSLGYNRESLGALGSSVSMRLRGSPEELPGLARFAGEVGGVYGMGDDAVISGLATAQRYGSTDAAASYERYANVFADEDGNISNYAMNVLQPALLQVTESMSIRNLARSTEELEKEVTTFGRNVITGDGRLSDLAQVNPNIIGQMLQGLQQASSMGATDPAVAALDMANGASVADIFLGRASVGANRLQHIINQGGFAGKTYGGADDFLNSQGGIGTFRAAQSLMPGMDSQSILAMIELAMQGNLLSPTGEMSESALEVEREARGQSIVDSKPGEISRSLSEQVDEFLSIQTTLIPQLLDLQTSLMAFLDNPNFVTIMTEFINSQSANFLEIAEGWEAKNQLSGSGDIMTLLQGTGINTAFADLTRVFSRNPGASGEWDALFEGMTRQTSQEEFNEIYRTYMGRYTGEGGESRSTGGFTGMGGRHQATGTVHAGEYVISSDNVSGNREILDRIQSGERVGSSSVTQGAGNVTYVTMKIHGASREEILSDARRVTEEYIVRNRLNYT